MWAFLIGFVLIASAIAGYCWIEKRKFYRRNHAGVQEFDSYGSSLKARTIEGFVNFLVGMSAIVGFGCIIFNIF